MFQHAALLFVLALVFQTSEATAPPRQDWVQKDLARIAQFREALRGKDIDVETLVEKFGAIDARDDQDAGFGARRVRMHLYGGYTTIWIEILAEQKKGEMKSRIAELRARQLVPPDRWSALNQTFAAAWGESATPIENGFQFTRRDDELALSLRRKTAAALGGADPVVVPKELSAAFERLTSSFERVILGTHHGDGGGPPPGRREIEMLAEANRFDLVRAVLRGVNPEGRLYAAWELRRRPGMPLSPEDARAIDALLALGAEVLTAEGCELLWRSPKDALGFLEKGK